MPRSRAASTAGSGKKGKKRLNVAVLGSGGVGKSCLTVQFVQNRWIDSYDPTIEDSYVKELEVEGEKITLEVQDTAGTEQFASMRDSYIYSNDVYLLVFSLSSHSSFDELEALYHQILCIYEQRLISAVPDLSAISRAHSSSAAASATSLASVPFNPVDYAAGLDQSKPRRRNRGGPNPLTSPTPLTEPSTPTTEQIPGTPTKSHHPTFASSFPPLPPLPFLILANKADLPLTQHSLSKADIASQINRWHRRYQAKSATSLPIPAPKVLTTSARSRINVDEAFYAVAEVGMKFNQWISSFMPPQPSAASSIISRNPFSRANSSNIQPSTSTTSMSTLSTDDRSSLSAPSTSRLPSRIAKGRNRGDTRASQSTTGSGSGTNRTHTSSGSTSSRPATAAPVVLETPAPSAFHQHPGSQVSRAGLLATKLPSAPTTPTTPTTPSAQWSRKKNNFFSRSRETKMQIEITAGGGGGASGGGKNGGCVVM